MGESSPPDNLTELDRRVLSQTDEEYTLLSWEFIKAAIAENRLDKLTRLPSQLRKYRAWSEDIREQYGSITNFLVQKRLYWQPLPSDEVDSAPKFAAQNTIPFAERSDYRILINDWPYGLEPGITHVCVWLKAPLPSDERGQMEPLSRELATSFVNETFAQGLGVESEDRVVWFRNPPALQSVRSVDHLHVLIRGVDRRLIDKIVENPPFT